MAANFMSKTEILQRQFFPDRPDADLSDIIPARYPQEIPDDSSITEDEVRRIIGKLPSGKATCRAGITNEFL